jgi:hypothetical protein
MALFLQLNLGHCYIFVHVRGGGKSLLESFRSPRMALPKPEGALVQRGLWPSRLVLALLSGSGSDRRITVVAHDDALTPSADPSVSP